MSCRVCQVERAKQCAECGKYADRVEMTVTDPASAENWFWCCPCGQNPKWRQERCPKCGRFRPDLVK